MRVQTENNLLYDSAHPKCQFHLARTHGHGFAFIQCLDLGHDGKAQRVKRYWGLYSDSLDDEVNKQAIYHIINNGSPWPTLPK